jgi:hypothetical protein
MVAHFHPLGKRPKDAAKPLEETISGLLAKTRAEQAEAAASAV